MAARIGFFRDSAVGIEATRMKKTAEIRFFRNSAVRRESEICDCNVSHNVKRIHRRTATIRKISS